MILSAASQVVAITPAIHGGTTWLHGLLLSRRRQELHAECLALRIVRGLSLPHRHVEAHNAIRKRWIIGAKSVGVAALSKSIYVLRLLARSLFWRCACGESKQYNEINPHEALLCESGTRTSIVAGEGA